MGHQYRHYGSPGDVGMRRIFPIVLIRGIRLPPVHNLYNQEGLTSEMATPVEDTNLPSTSTSSSSTASSSRISHGRRKRKRPFPSQPLRRSPRLNKGL